MSVHSDIPHDFAARSFFDELRARFDGEAVLEPRHETWFTADVEKLLYPAEYLRIVARLLDASASSNISTWCIFDNTALGAATTDALT